MPFGSADAFRWNWSRCIIDQNFYPLSELWSRDWVSYCTLPREGAWGLCCLKCETLSAMASTTKMWSSSIHVTLWLELTETTAWCVFDSVMFDTIFIVWLLRKILLKICRRIVCQTISRLNVTLEEKKTSNRTFLMHCIVTYTLYVVNTALSGRQKGSSESQEHSRACQVNVAVMAINAECSVTITIPPKNFY